jgi:excisionase family DNA binding protein
MRLTVVIYMHRIKDMAKRLDVGEPTIRRWISQGLIKIIRLPRGTIRIPDSEAIKLLEGNILIAK